MSFKKLEQTGAIQTLIYLLKVDTASKTDISNNIDATFETLNKKTLPYLEELELLVFRKLIEFPYTHIYSLTNKGKTLAECINKIIQ